MQSEIDEIRAAISVLREVAGAPVCSRDFLLEGLRHIEGQLALIELQQPHTGTVNLPVMTLATIARAAARERAAQGKAPLQVIQGGRHA